MVRGLKGRGSRPGERTVSGRPSRGLSGRGRHGPHGTRGIGLRPHPRAPLSRPVGPEGPAVRSSLSSQRKLIWMSLLVSSCCKGKSRRGTPKHRPFEAIESELYATDGWIGRNFPDLYGGIATSYGSWH